MNGLASRPLCRTHPHVDYKHAWGCPDCLLELRKRNNKLEMACHLVLLFHNNGPWTDTQRQMWDLTMGELLGPIAEREQPNNESTTKNLCNAIRAALNATAATTKQTV